MLRIVFLIGGLAALLFGAVGAFVPLLPTIPFFILAAFCFARSSPALERWLVENRHFGPHIVAWRARGAISSRGKRAALIAFAVSAGLGFVLLSWPWSLVPLLTGLIGGSWVLSRPDD